MKKHLQWLPAILPGIPLLLAYLTFTQVDLTPQVDQRFFFTPGSAIYEEHRSIDRRFATQELLVVTAYAEDIGSRAYLDRVRQLSDRLARVPSVTSVRSLAVGPEGLADARESPLWRRLLLLDGIQASNLILVVDPGAPRPLIDAVQQVLREAEGPEFRLRLAGVPYIVDAIGRNLEHDFRIFSMAAVGVFAVLTLLLFRSLAILLGSLTACASAALATLLVQQWLGGRIGLLTANIVTIAFVLTQSHVVFMTNNWRGLRPQSAGAAGAMRRAFGQTLLASGWCMVTALLGFATLLYVEAQPLRELGKGGIVATTCALAAAYVIFPPFLLWARPPKDQRNRRERRDRGEQISSVSQNSASSASSAVNTSSLGLPPRWAAALLLLAALAAGAGALRVNSDPSLLDYFAADSDIHRGLALIDAHGGSSPLHIVVRRKDRQRLDNDESYRRMWALQRALQEDAAVGTVLSLPVLMAEVNRSFLARLLPWRWLLDKLSEPEYDRAAEAFVNKSRTEALFLLRMVEADREERRTEVIARLQRVVARHGFEARLTGGIYALQGRLADLVVRSLYEGLAGLLLACALIALIITRSPGAALAMAACTAAIPAVILGAAGFARVPLDIVVTPAVNVAVGVAVDSMIHFAAAWRRARRTRFGGAALRQAQAEQAGGILAFFLVVAAGFAIFLLSNFPPTQRFGVAVVLGTAVAAAMAVWIFPGLLSRPGRAADPR